MITLKVGEIREVAFQFESDETFVIDSANYIVMDNLGKELSKGKAQINKEKVTALFTATNTGEFKVLFEINIENEIYKLISIIHIK